MCYYKWQMAGCSGDLTDAWPTRFGGGNSTSWTAPSHASETAPPDAAAIWIECNGVNAGAFYDQFYLNEGSWTGF